MNLPELEKKWFKQKDKNVSIKKFLNGFPKKQENIPIEQAPGPKDIQIEQQQQEAIPEKDIPLNVDEKIPDIQQNIQEETPINIETTPQPQNIREELTTPVGPRPKTSFDVQRERVEAGAERERQRREEALRRRLAARGVTGGEQDKQIRLMMADIERSKQEGLGDIRIAESALEEKRRDEERAREFEKEFFGLKLGGEKELLGIKGQQELEKLGIQIQGQKDITKLQGDITKDLETLKNSFEEGKEDRKIKSQRYFDLGVSGQEMTEDELRNLELNDPVAFNAYMAGKAGMSKNDYLADLELREEYRKAAITGLDPDDPSFQDKLKLIYQQLGIDVGLGQGNQGTEQLQQQIDVKDKIKAGEILTPEQYADVLSNPEKYDVITTNPPQMAGALQWRDNGNFWGLTSEASNWVDQNMGKLIKAPNGRVYQVAGKDTPRDTNDSWGIRYKDMETGEIVTISNRQGGGGLQRDWPRPPVGPIS